MKNKEKRLFYHPMCDSGNMRWCDAAGLDDMMSAGCYVVQLRHSSENEELPFGYCDDEHYIVAVLIVTESGTDDILQKNRAIGQCLTMTSCDGKETKVFTRLFADGVWSVWRSLAHNGMYDNISTTDELLATVDSLVSENTRAKEVEESVKRTAVDISSLACTAGNENITITAISMDGEVVHSVEIPVATTENAGVMSAEDKQSIDKMFVVPKNNCYLTSPTGNKYIVRLYIENKDAARADKLWLRQIANTSQNNCLVAFSSDVEAWVPIISFGNRANTKVETNNYTVGGVKAKYGKIAIIAEDWNDAELWGNRTEVTFARPESGTNLEDICFDWNEFSKPMQPSLNIADGSITQEKLSQEVNDKLDSGVQAAEGVASLEEVVNDIAIIPNNNNYLKGWTKGNDLTPKSWTD